MSDRPNNLSLLTRRHTLAALAGLPVAASVPPTSAQPSPVRPTPQQSLGPFYPRSASERPRETDADLLVVQGDRVLSRGVALYLTGRVLDRQGAAVTDAQVEIWQCDTRGRYRHPRDGGTPAEVDEGFQGYGEARTAPGGEVAFRTIRPTPYTGRTPHIHVKLRHASFGEFTSQLFVDGDAGNAGDFLWRRLDAAERTALALRLQPATEGGLRWQARHTLVLPA